jgi:hypothetical protein
MDDQFEWLHERLTHHNLDQTTILTFTRVGSWMGLRVQELFQLTGNGSFRWEWEDEYARLPYQKQAATLDEHTTYELFYLFQAGLPALQSFHREHPLPALPPDSIPAYFSITVGDHQARYMYPPQFVSPTRGSSAPSELKHLLDQFARLRKLQLDGA